MVDTSYVFGTYRALNSNYDPNFRTEGQLKGKWRSQIPVRLDYGLRVSPTGDPWIYLANVEEGFEFRVPIVAISDTDYYAQSTAAVNDSYWIDYEQGSPKSSDRFIGYDAFIKSTLLVQTEPLSAENPNADLFGAVPLTSKPVILPDIPFVEERLELGYDYGAVGGASFATEIVKMADERETRNSNLVLPIHRYQLGDRNVAESERDKLSEVSYLKQFHADRQGSYQGFRYKDWVDYQSIHQLIGVGDGTITQWQLRKGYFVGNTVTWRPITKPVVGTVVLYANGIEQMPAQTPGAEGWTVDHATGVISNPEPLGAGAVLTASFDFDLPVRFESDSIDFSLSGYEEETEDAIYKLGSVFVKEIRFPLVLPWQIQPASKISEELNLGIVYDTVEQYSFNTDREEMRSLWDIAKPNRKDSKVSFNLGEVVYDREETNKLLSYFWNAKGSHELFSFSNKRNSYLVRFNGDSLNFKFAAANNNDALFNISDLKLYFNEVYLKTPVFLGFTAASGAYGQKHKILNATFQGENILVQNLFFKGASYFTSDGIILTTGADYEAGAFYLNREILIRDLLDLRMYFSYSIDSARLNDRNRQSDGLAFVLHPVTYTSEPLPVGGAIGYQGVDKSVAVELDTFFNDQYDFNNNHVAININGNIDNKTQESEFSATPSFDIRGTRYCWIEYRSSRLEVYLSLDANKPLAPLVSRTLNWLDIFKSG